MSLKWTLLLWSSGLTFVFAGISTLLLLVSFSELKAICLSLVVTAVFEVVIVEGSRRMMVKAHREGWISGVAAGKKFAQRPTEEIVSPNEFSLLLFSKKPKDHKLN